VVCNRAHAGALHLELCVELKHTQDLIDDTLHLSGMFLPSLQLYYKVLLYVWEL